MLYLLPFILAAIAFLRFTFGPDDFSVCPDLGVISIPAFQEQGGLWWKEIGVLALLCLSFLVFFVADRYKFCLISRFSRRWFMPCCVSV